MRYVDDNLLLVQEKDIKLIHERLNSFDKNIRFTIDNFPGGNVHFLDCCKQVTNYTKHHVNLKKSNLKI